MPKFPFWQPKIESNTPTSMLPQIHNKNRGNFFLEVFNSKGKSLHNDNCYFFTSGQYNFSHITNLLPPGIYTITLTDQNNGLKNSIKYINL